MYLLAGFLLIVEVFVDCNSKGHDSFDGTGYEEDEAVNTHYEEKQREILLTRRIFPGLRSDDEKDSQSTLTDHQAADIENGSHCSGFLQ